LKKNPLVSVICLCHNQAAFVKEALDSVFDQTYSNVELIVVDDGSKDGSQRVIKESIVKRDIEFISLDKSLGNCKAFNIGFKKTRGDFIIDLAADDVLLHTRISEGIKTFGQKEIGVEFCNVMNVDEAGDELSVHFTQDHDVPEGDIYLNLIEKYIISPPGMMIKRAVLESLGGYDESLHYEDFDFWIRSSRNYTYGYTNKILVKKRILRNSHSKKQFKFRNKHQKSTLKVCEKILHLNKSKLEDKALKIRGQYEIRQAIKSGNIELIPDFIKLIRSC